VKRGTPPGLGFLDEELGRAKERDLLRERPPPTDRRGLSFSSNDYLALASELGPPEASGAGASRLVTGDRPIHARLEEGAAELVGQPAALVFTSGYAANVGLLSALAGPGDLVVSDAPESRVHHRRCAPVAGARRGGAAPRRRGGRGRAADPHGGARLRRDGVVFQHGRRLAGPRCPAAGVRPAWRRPPRRRGPRPGCPGAGRAWALRRSGRRGGWGGRDVREGVRGGGGRSWRGARRWVAWLWNRARSFVFSTGLSPAVAAAAPAGYPSRAGPSPSVDDGSWPRRGFFAREWRAWACSPAGFGQIVPWVPGRAGQGASGWPRPSASEASMSGRSGPPRCRRDRPDPPDGGPPPTARPTSSVPSRVLAAVLAPGAGA
jgi:hypothetical protein